MTRSLLLLAIVSICVACAEPAPPVDARGDRGVDARVASISGASPFVPGCAPEPVQAFGERVEDAEMETWLAVNPRNPANLVVAWMQDIFSGLVTAASRDGGRHWTIAPVAGSSACTGGDFDIAADPTLSFGPDGTLYLAGFSLDLPAEELPLPSRTRLFALASRDGGFSWDPLVEVAGGYGTLHDMPAITADPRVPCTAYLVWTDQYTAFGPASPGLMFARTDDCGRTWSAPATVFAPTETAAPFSITMGSKLLAMNDGSLLVVTTALSSLLAVSSPELPVTAPESVVAFRSLDGGATWSTAQHVAAFVTGPFHDPETGDKVLASSFILSAASGPDGTAYVAWRQHLDESTADIRVVRTADHGRTWSDPLIVRAAGAQMMTPTVAVGGDGTVAVTYYDIRNDALADHALWADVWVSQSTDAGATWTEDHVAGPFDLGSAANLLVPTEGLMVGEYAGLAAVPGGFAATFAMSGAQATAGASDIFFAQIRSHGSAR